LKLKNQNYFVRNWACPASSKYSKIRSKGSWKTTRIAGIRLMFIFPFVLYFVICKIHKFEFENTDMNKERAKQVQTGNHSKHTSYVIL
jgi:hypothetical protein